MRIAKNLPELREAIGTSRELAFVPTMGNLHEGHLSLVRLARERASYVITSIFVNRLQFAPQEDFAAYPRTLEQDIELLSRAGCQAVFVPDEHILYPEPQEWRVSPPASLADILEGEFRPGFFTGVSTVVLKLFNVVRPSIAVFGKKDYQQLRVIQSMVKQLALPVEIVAGETVRDTTGLALSSRNAYLSAAEALKAPFLQATLKKVATVVRAGVTDWLKLEQEAVSALRSAGWSPDYVAVRTQADLRSPSKTEPLIVVGAAKLGNTRLIDNVEI